MNRTERAKKKLLRQVQDRDKTLRNESLEAKKWANNMDSVATISAGWREKEKEARKKIIEYKSRQDSKRRLKAV